jgi:hypothetical protein
MDRINDPIGEGSVIDEPLVNAVVNGTAEVTTFIPSVYERGPRIESRPLVDAARLDP